MSIFLTLVYYGSFPNYFQLYLDSLNINKNLLNIILITDINIDKYDIPSNVIIVKMSLLELKNRIVNFFKLEYNINLNTDDVLKFNYKLCDYKIIYYILFANIYKSLNICENDYIGYCDCDMIYGNLNNFIDLSKNYDLLGHHGHFTAFKNNNLFKNLYKNIPNLKEFLLDNKYNVLDEKYFRQEIFNLVSKYNLKCFYMDQYFCDIIPQKKNLLFNDTKIKANIKYLKFNKSLGVLNVYYDNDDFRETTYAHLQKRNMSYNFDAYDNIFYINELSFDL